MRFVETGLAGADEIEVEPMTGARGCCARRCPPVAPPWVSEAAL